MDEDDSLAFHYDKELDLEKDSLIVNVSFGATRPIVFQEIEGRKRQTIMLRPGSMLALGPKTNKRFVHSTPKLFEETGPRVSLSLRHTQTFVDQGSMEIMGKGEQHQTQNYPFIKSHDDVSQYSEALQQQIAHYTQRARARCGRALASDLTASPVYFVAALS